ncbi:MAG TPA: hypothetical protein VK448_07650 [Dissulfurispiraceae bacterium]|nr:hypothetical protein [Dissulfurispiraceae bacterium]
MKRSAFVIPFLGLLVFTVLTSCAIGGDVRDPDAIAPRAPTVSEPQKQPEGGVINPKTGEYLQPAGSGVVSPRTGDYYFPAANGYFNPKTGEFIPKKH